MTDTLLFIILIVLIENRVREFRGVNNFYIRVARFLRRITGRK